MLEVKPLESLEECVAYESFWKKLVESMSYPSPFVHPEWVLTAMKANKHKWQPYILLIKDKGEATGILPLYKNMQNTSIVELGFAGDCYYPDPLGLCCTVENRKDCINIFRDYLYGNHKWDILRLKWLLHDEAMEWKNSSAIIKNTAIAPYISLHGTFQEYLSKFKKRKIYFATRKVKKFEKSNGEYFSTRSTEKCRELLERLFFLHKNRSVERGIVSTFCGEEIISFHNKMLDNSENIYVHWLTLNSEIIAVLYGFLFQGRFFYYQISHDIKHGSLSPGVVLLYKAIEQCCKMGIQEFNLLQGDEAYKWKWTKDSRSLYMVTMYNRTLSGTILKQKEKTRLIAKKLYVFLKNIRNKNNINSS